MDPTVDLEHERDQNPLSKFYPGLYERKEPRKTEPQSVALWVLENYTHEDALRFGIATQTWKDLSALELPELDPQPAFSCQPTTSVDPKDQRPRAYYRVVGERKDGYTLQCCHVNVHASRRDLQYVVVNNTTKTTGMEGMSTVHQLFIGDILEVTQLVPLQKLEDTITTKPGSTKPIWLATQISILFRTITHNVMVFIQPSGKAIVQGHPGIISVHSSGTPTEPGKSYHGSIFEPEIFKQFFTRDFKEPSENELIIQSASVKQAEQAKPIIFKLQEFPNIAKALEIGRDALKVNHGLDPAKVLETCVLLGNSATVSADLPKKWYTAKKITRKEDIIYFTVDKNFSLDSDTIELCTKDSRYNATVLAMDTVTHQKKTRIQVTARLGKVPAPLETEAIAVSPVKTHYALQQLQTGFFAKLTQSHGRKTIVALYGGPQVYCNPLNFPQLTGFFVNKDLIVDLDENQCRYIDNLLEDIPIVVGSAPPGSGKSTTIITAAYDLWEVMDPWKSVRNKQIIIAHDDYSTSKLIEIAEAFPKNPLQFNVVRYVPDGLSKVLPPTELDLPYLMLKEFQLWAYGYRKSNKMSTGQKMDVLSWLIKESHVTPYELNCEALEIHDSFKVFKPSEVAHQKLLEAFFTLYDPVVTVINMKHLGSFLEHNLWLKNVIRAVQIDDAHLLHEHTLINLLSLFPNASFGLLGDPAQVEEPRTLEVCSKLKDYGIGHILELARTTRKLPFAEFTKIYRTPLEISDILEATLYQDKTLFPFHYFAGYNPEYCKLLEKRWDFFPSPHFPILIFNNPAKAWTNPNSKKEVEMVASILTRITEKGPDGYKWMHPSDIGIITMNSAQTIMLQEHLVQWDEVTIGSLDTFKGTDKMVIIFCCLNEKIREGKMSDAQFIQAISRAKQATVILGNVECLKAAKCWSTVVKYAEESNCVKEGGQINIKIPSGTERVRRQKKRESYEIQPPLQRSRRQRQFPQQWLSPSPVPQQQWPAPVQTPPQWPAVNLQQSQCLAAALPTPPTSSSSSGRNCSQEEPSTSQLGTQEVEAQPEIGQLLVAIPPTQEYPGVAFILQMNPEDPQVGWHPNLGQYPMPPKYELPAFTDEFVHEQIRLMTEYQEAQEEAQAELEMWNENRWWLCQICRLPYLDFSSETTPKILHCGHTFCESCLSKCIHDVKTIKCQLCEEVSIVDKRQLRDNYKAAKKQNQPTEEEEDQN